MKMEKLMPGTKKLIKKCHHCGQIIESYEEIKKCLSCKKSFLPSNYFSKVHAKTSQEFEQLYSLVKELHEEDLVRGLHVIW